MTKDNLEELITEYGKHLYSFCCNLTGNRLDADDLYQETILKAVELCHRLDSSGNPKSYLMGISARLWKNYRRKHDTRRRILPMTDYEENLMQEVADENLQPEKEAIRKEMILAVRSAVKKLPEKIQIVLYMYYTAEMSIEEISKALHIPMGTVKSRLYKGREKLKKEVWGYD